METLESYKRRTDVATGKIPADLVLKNGKVIDVFNGGWMDGDVAIIDGTIVGVGRYSGKEERDVSGLYLSPSFIDGHAHVESAMVTPTEFARIVLPHGVTAIVADPHEIANVAGADGIDYLLADSEGLPMDFFFMLPSCVPATSFEQAGAELDAEALQPYYSHPRVLGLGEVMDYPSVAAGNRGILKKILDASRHGLRVDGHAAGIGPEGINAYAAVGIRSDHECVSADEARERLKRGMYLMIREGSVAKNLQALLPVVTERNARRCLLVTDDKHVDDLAREGSVNHPMQMAIRQGLDPVTAIQMVTLNTAECFGIPAKGAIAPGYDADIVALEDLSTGKVERVWKGGRLVAENGRLLADAIADHRPELPVRVKESIRLAPLSPSDLHLPLTTETAHVIGIIPDSLITEHRVETVFRQEGRFIPDPDKDLLKLAVVERHRATGSAGIGIVKGLGLKRGAIGSTVAHDSHNMILAGTNDRDMLLAAQALKQMNGGLVAVEDGEIVASLPLPIAGLLSDQPAQSILEPLSTLNQQVRRLGVSITNPFVTLSFLALPVIPHLKLTDQGLFDTDRQCFIAVDTGEALA
ncbi:adenine deaminase [Desmospora profundinema]|uniref:Adenine deaminase n=1 Tax=Desmospora profundinema TaxID=1571184 RepID=A0ABU1IP01_9BACL|nr:adenine deaminase [Desmospora profundinema]MDR6226515.1 adenine deaminase [Desmospora profundinema]